jgi:ferric hydroxamate transport system ATP-binding protein
MDAALSAEAGPGLGSAAFTTRDLSFAVEERVLLHPLNLRIEAGEIAGLIGQNGSGKSTLLKLLARQQTPTAGHISFAGRPLESWNGRAFARMLAYLPQDTPQGLEMTVGELVAHGRYPWHGALGRFGETDRRKTAEAMRLTQIEDLADRMIGTLSGGERQRAWIAMMVAQDARCLLLDEPTSALDMAHQVEILSLIRQLGRDHGLSVLIVLHDINMAARFCDRLYALKGGKLIAEGAPQTLMTATTLHDIYGIAMDVMPHPKHGAPLAYVL